jgi:RNA polymerase sigma-70 factor (ECF subfamily)
MDGDTLLAQRFEEHRPYLRAVAHRMLGSTGEAEDAVQDAWLRLSRSGDGEIENLRAWLTTVVARLCLNTLQTRARRGEEPLDAHVPDPVVDRAEAAGAPGRPAADPAQQAVLADSVGLALLVVLETLTPAERLAFVLHDMFGVTFDEIAPMVDRTPAAARQLASRARRRVRGTDGTDGTGRRSAAELRRQRAVVDAFFAAARQGDLERLVGVLHPDVVLRSDGGTALAAATGVERGARAVAGRAARFSRPAAELRPVLVDGGPGVLVVEAGRLFSVMGFTVAGGRIVAIDVLADPERLAALDLSGVGEG